MLSAGILGLVRDANQWQVIQVASDSKIAKVPEDKDWGQPLKNKNTDKAVTWYVLDRIASNKLNSFQLISLILWSCIIISFHSPPLPYFSFSFP